MNLELTPSAIFHKLSSHIDQSLNTQPSVQSTHLNPIKKILVAYSGGLDSHVLLHLLSSIPRNQFDLRAVYINHGLQSQAAEWDAHCHNICEELEIPFKSIDLNLEIPKGESLEEVARKARYRALYALLEKDEILTTAHHQNDQAETLLLQLFRGAGVQGLAAMPSLSEIKINKKTHLHFRPLLDQSRQALEAYAKEFGLKHIEDPSNQDIAFDRNFLRQEIMPLLRNRWLGLDKVISRTASLQAETKTLLDEVAEQELPLVLASATKCIIQLFADNKDESKVLAPIAIPELLKQSEEKQRLLIRYWITQQGFTPPSAKKLQHIFSDMIQSSKDKQPCVEWSGAELRRFQNHLYIMSPLTEHDATQEIQWQIDGPLYIPSINLTLDPQLVVGNTNIAKVTVRFRQGGETIEISKRGNISLKNLFQELQIPPWIRSRLPLIYVGEKLIKVCGLEDLKTHPSTF